MLNMINDFGDPAVASKILLSLRHRAPATPPITFTHDEPILLQVIEGLGRELPLATPSKIIEVVSKSSGLSR